MTRAALPRAVIALLLAGAAIGARAQTSGGFALQTFEPAPAGDRFFSFPDAEVKGHVAPTAALALSWARDPLVLRRDHAALPGGALVSSAPWAFAQGSLPLGDRLLLDLALPVALAQAGEQPVPERPRVRSTALGDARLGARAPLPSLGSLVRFAAAIDLWLPTGARSAYASDGAFRGRPKLVMDGDLPGLPVSWGAEVGVLLRDGRDHAFTRTGDALTCAAGAALRLGALRIGPEVYGRYQFSGTATSPLEGLLGAAWTWRGLDVGAAVGTSFDDAPGAAPLRVIARVAWTPGAPQRPAASPAPAAAPARAPSSPAPAPAAGPPAPPPASPGPPPRIAVPAFGSPEPLALPPPSSPLPPPASRPLPASRSLPDRDRDGIPDELDACPDHAGPPSADPRRNGCPALAAVVGRRIQILQRIQFETDRDVIRPESEPVLRDVAAVLAAHPEITRVWVEGHTDGAGEAARNALLSEQRARAVLRWLVRRGVALDRLQARGLGPSRPIGNNRTPQGRAANRRVEFRIE